MWNFSYRFFACFVSFGELLCIIYLTSAYVPRQSYHKDLLEQRKASLSNQLPLAIRHELPPKVIQSIPADDGLSRSQPAKPPPPAKVPMRRGKRRHHPRATTGKDSSSVWFFFSHFVFGNSFTTQIPMGHTHCWGRIFAPFVECRGFAFSCSSKSFVNSFHSYSLLL